MNINFYNFLILLLFSMFLLSDFMLPIKSSFINNIHNNNKTNIYDSLYNEKIDKFVEDKFNEDKFNEDKFNKNIYENKNDFIKLFNIKSFDNIIRFIICL